MFFSAIRMFCDLNLLVDQDTLGAAQHTQNYQRACFKQLLECARR
jgi:hypothetical protein